MSVQSYVQVAILPSSWWCTPISASQCQFCRCLFTLKDDNKFIDVGMAAVDGFVEPVLSSLHSSVASHGGDMHVPHGRQEVTVEPRVVVVGHHCPQPNVLPHEGVC